MPVKFQNDAIIIRPSLAASCFGGKTYCPLVNIGPAGEFSKHIYPPGKWPEVVSIQIMIWHRTGTKPLLRPVPNTHMCFIGPEWNYRSMCHDNYFTNDEHIKHQASEWWESSWYIFQSTFYVVISLFIILTTIYEYNDNSNGFKLWLTIAASRSRSFSDACRDMSTSVLWWISAMGPWEAVLRHFVRYFPSPNVNHLSPG